MVRIEKRLVHLHQVQVNKMSKYFFIFIAVIILISGGFFIYYYYEKPAQEQVLEFVDFNIFAKNSDGNLIKTGYHIYSDGNLYESGETSSRAGVRHKVPRNKTIFVYNYDLNSDNIYYSQRTNDINSLEIKPYRITLKLEQPGNLTMNYSGVFGVDQKLNVNFKSTEVNRNLKVCLKWSSHIIYIKTDLELLDQTNLEKGFDKCYNFNDIFDESSFLLDYEIFGNINEKDYIEIKFVGYNIDVIDNNTQIKNFDQEFLISLNI